jgi:hypothetical protein
MVTHQSHVDEQRADNHLAELLPEPCPSVGPPLEQWRMCRLLEVGFPARLAESLSRQRVDLHALLELVDAGCPPPLAARILAPIDDLSPSSAPRAGR